MPAGDRLVDRFDGFQDLDLRRKFLESAAPVVISRTDQYLFEFVQDIQLGDDDGLQVVQDGRIEGRNPIEPSAAAGSARRGSEFGSPSSDFVSDGTVGFGGEGPPADSGGVGLGNSDHSRNPGGGYPGSHTSRPGSGIRRGDIGVGSVVDVEERPLGAFEQHPFAAPDMIVQEKGRIHHEFLQPLTILQVLLVDLPGIQGWTSIQGLNQAVLLSG